MQDKYELLGQVQRALAAGTITEDDLAAFMTAPQAATVALATPLATQGHATDRPEKLSAVDIMFYIAGIVLFSAILSFIVQSMDSGDSGVIQIALSAGIGMLLWTLTVYLFKASKQTELREGLRNAIMLTGSLLLMAGGYIIITVIQGSESPVNLAAIAAALAVLSGMHIGFDRILKHDFTLLLGVFLGVAAFPVLLCGIISRASFTAATDVYAVIVISAAILLAYATRVIARVYSERTKIRTSFDGFTAFIVLGTMYAASFSDYGVLWMILLCGSVLGLFYLSIVRQSKRLLGTASFFLVVTLITISFKYFSGLGATASLVFSALGLLGSAATATNINRRYFKHS